jgi:hypothetical protein
MIARSSLLSRARSDLPLKRLNDIANGTVHLFFLARRLFMHASSVWQNLQKDHAHGTYVYLHSYGSIVIKNLK